MNERFDDFHDPELEAWQQRGEARRARRQPVRARSAWSYFVAALFLPLITAAAILDRVSSPFRRGKAQTTDVRPFSSTKAARKRPQRKLRVLVASALSIKGLALGAAALAAAGVATVGVRSSVGPLPGLTNEGAPLEGVFTTTTSETTMTEATATTEAAGEGATEFGKPKAHEIVGMRGRASETFVTDEGEYQTKLYAQPVNYEDAKGGWQHISNTLVESKRQGFKWQNEANAYKAHFAQSMKDGFLRFDAADGTTSVTVSLADSKTTGAVKDTENGLSFKNVLQQTDLTYETTGAGLKETLVLRQKNAPSSFVFTLSPVGATDLSFEPRPDGGLTFYANGQPEPAFSIDPATVADSDASGAANPPAEGKATMSATKLADGSIELSVKIDEAWLSDSARVFPVFLDPNYNAVTDAQDGYYNETAGGNPNTTDTALFVGKSGSGGPVYGSVVNFDLATIPVGAQVTSVRPNLYLDWCFPVSCSPGTTNGTVEMRGLTSGWGPSTPWSAVSKDSTLLASRYLNAGPGGDGANTWYPLNPSGAALQSSIQSMVNGSLANYGFIFEKTGGNANIGFKFRSARYGDTTYAPYLDVYWQTPGVTLGPTPQVRANGADLSWSRWDGGAAAYSNTVLGDAPIGYWRLDETTGNVAQDSSASLQPGAYQSHVTLGQPGALTDSRNKAATFEATSTSYIGGPTMALNARSFTLEAWAKRASNGNWHAILMQGTATNNQRLRFGFLNTNVFTCGFYNNDLNTSATYTDSNWHHWACTYDQTSKSRKIYRDGTVVASDTASADYAGTGAIRFGAGPAGDNLFDGSIDEIAIYPTALSQTNLQAHYSAAAVALPNFQRYEIHRGTTSSFTPSESTLVGTLTDQALQTFKDTTAKANTTFYYKVVAVTSAGNQNSNEVPASLPASGTVQITIQPGLSVTDTQQGTYITSAAPTTEHGGEPTLITSSNSRALLKYELRAIPSNVTIDSAQLQLYTYQPNVNTTINVHRVTSDWHEDATWNKESWNMPAWATAGGDFAATASASTVSNGASPHWDAWDVKDLIQTWTNGDQAYLGFLLKNHTEAGAPSLQWLADFYPRSVALRPKLTVTYQDPTNATVIAPQAFVNNPGPSELIKGTVTLSAGASDDGRITSVQYKLDGSNLAAALSTPTEAPNIFNLDWDSTSASYGQHTLTIVATDDAGNVTTSDPVSFTVANSSAPSASVTSATPQASPNQSKFDVTATASDDNAISKVEFLVDGDRFATKTTSPWTATLDTLGSGSGSSQPYDQAVLADTPVGYWRLGESSGTSAADASGTGNTGTYVGPTLGAAGLIESSNTAADFDATDSVSVPNSTSLNPTSAITLEAWVTPDTLGPNANDRRTIIEKNLAYWLRVDNVSGTQTARMYIYTGGQWKAIGTPVVAGTTYHLVGTYDGAALKIYKNGVLANSVAQTGAVSTNTNTVFVSEGNTTGAWDGRIDEPAIYASALSATQIQAHYAAGTPATQAAAFPVYDGQHEITIKAYDADENSTVSTASTITVDNANGTKYKGTVSTTNVPPEMQYDPAAGTQANAPLTVSLQNTSGQTWSDSTTKLRYRWLNPDGSEFSSSSNVSIGGDLAAGNSRDVTVSVAPPTLAASIMRGRFTLRIDLFDTSAGAYFAAKGSKPLEQRVTVTRIQESGLGSQPWESHDGTTLGSGWSAATNLFNGNLLVGSILSSEPGIGLGTTVDLTYNSLEKGSVSPMGNSWLLSVSGLAPFGLPLDIHPNAADQAAGRTANWIGFTELDGAYVRFTLNASGNFYDAPPGVHLYLRQIGSGYAMTTTGGTTYNFDTSGYATGVTDSNGSSLTFTQSATPSGGDAFGLEKQITKVTDQSGRDYTIAYYGKSDPTIPALRTTIPELRGKVASITDHVGHQWRFDYYDDGNLLSVTEEGGMNADGSYLADRVTTFTYTTADGTGPAIAAPEARHQPNPSTTQSTRLFGVLDARGNETQFAYMTSGTSEWRVARVTNRNGIVSSSYSYDDSTRTTTVSYPVVPPATSNSWTYVFDSRGRNTMLMQPAPFSGVTTQEWTSDNQVSQVTEPAGATLTFTYNANGLQTDSYDGLQSHASSEYENLPVDGNDIENHLSRLLSTTNPAGHTTTYAYADTSHPMEPTTITDPAGNATTMTYEASGQLASKTLPVTSDGIDRTTHYESYDANGLPTRVRDAAQNVTQTAYDEAGRLLWTQDANHQGLTGGDPTQYRSELHYDSFGRMGRSSSPKSFALYPNVLLWSDVVYDANDNVVQEYARHFGYPGDAISPGASESTTPASSLAQFNAMDFQTLATSPRRDAQGNAIQTSTTYDAAGRVAEVVRPNGIGAAAKTDTSATSYDALGRVFQTTLFGGVEGNGNPLTRVTTNCYDLAGDLRSVTEPPGSQDFECPAAVDPAAYQPADAPHTTTYNYDAAHRQVRQTNSNGSFTVATYNANGQLTETKTKKADGTVVGWEKTSYDNRGLTVSTTRPLDIASGRNVVTVTNYNELGNVTSSVSPRAYEFAGSAPPYTNLVTSYTYDANNRVVKTALPSTPTGAYKLAVLNDNPSNYWRLGETSGTVATDFSGGDSGTLAGGYTLGQSGALGTSGETDKAASFNGSTGFARITDPVTFGSGDFTVEGWFKTSVTGATQTIFRSGQNPGGTVPRVAINVDTSNKLNFYCLSGTTGLTTTSSTTVTNGSWHAFAAVRSGSNFTLFLDGTQVAQSTGSLGSVDGTNQTTTIGAGLNTTTNSWINFFSGALDDVAVYKYALSASQVAAHYQAGTTQAPAQTYVYNTYDANGSDVTVSLPTTATTQGAVAPSDLVTHDYLDTGSLYTTLDGATQLSTRYDYSASGEQTARLPDGVGMPDVVDYSRAMYWDYLPDGLVLASRDLAGQRDLFTYDSDGRQLIVAKADGVLQASQSAQKIQRTYDGFGALTKTVLPKPGVAGVFLASSTSYDASGAITQTVSNQEVGGSNTPGRTQAYAYNSFGQLVSHTDDLGTPSTWSDDEKTSYQFLANGQLASQTLSKAGATEGTWTPKQSSVFGYYDNGLARSQTNAGGGGQTTEAHSLSYVSGGVYADGNKTSDVFTLKGPVSSAPCRLSPCTARWTYDPQGRLVSEDLGTGGGVTAFTLDPSGNITSQKTGTQTLTNTVSGHRLVAQTQGGITTRYIYDAFGNLACTVTSTWVGATCPAVGDPHLLTKNTYDYANRLESHGNYQGSASPSDSASYTYDALDRVASETETHSGGSVTTSTRYVGSSSTPASETLTGALTETKTYGTDVTGATRSVTHTSSGQTHSYSLSYSPQRSVSLVLDQQDSVKASYGYSAYGTSDAAVTKNASGFSTGSVPTNPVRFQGHRYDSGSSTYAMGARRYAAGASQWMQTDYFYSSGENAALSSNWQTADRYSFVGGNPINRAELDGHVYWDMGNGCWVNYSPAGVKLEEGCRPPQPSQQPPGNGVKPYLGEGGGGVGRPTDKGPGGTGGKGETSSFRFLPKCVVLIYLIQRSFSDYPSPSGCWAAFSLTRMKFGECRSKKGEDLIFAGGAGPGWLYDETGQADNDDFRLRKCYSHFGRATGTKGYEYMPWEGGPHVTQPFVQTYMREVYEGDRVPDPRKVAPQFFGDNAKAFWLNSYESPVVNVNPGRDVEKFVYSVCRNPGVGVMGVWGGQENVDGKAIARAMDECTS